MTNRIEQNLRLSFSYVKKDLLRVNEQIEAMNEKIQHIALNHASLLGALANLESKIAGKSKPNKKSQKKAAKKSTKKVVKETTTYE